MAALTRLCNFRLSQHLVSRVSLTSSAVRFTSSSGQSGITQAEMAAGRNYCQKPLSETSHIHNYRNYPANTPQYWMMPIKALGLGGFFPEPFTPLVCLFAFLFFGFLYQWNCSENNYEKAISEVAPQAGVNYAPAGGYRVIGSKSGAAASAGGSNEPSSNAHKADCDAINAIKVSNPGNIMAKSFTNEYFNSLSAKDQARLLQCCSSGLHNPTSELGAYAMNPTDYDDFYPFFKAVLETYHKVNLSETKHVNDWNLKGKAGLPADGVLDVSAFGITDPLSMRIRTARNLKSFPLPGAMNEEDRKNMELAMGPVFEALIKDPNFGGEYVSLTPGHANKISDERYQELVKAHIMFKDMSADSFLVDAGIAGDWPHGRGCYVSADKGFIIWVGEEDHLRIMAMKKSLKINDVFDRLKAAIDVVENLIPGGCAKSKDFGVITSCPTNMGTGMRASVHIKIPNLTKDGSDETAKTILKPYGLGVRGLGGEHTPIGADGTVDISPKARFCISEAQIAIALYKGVEKVMQEEKAAGQ